MAGSSYLVSINNNVATIHPDESYVDSAVANAIAESTTYSDNLAANTLLNANIYSDQSIAHAISQAVIDIFPPLIIPIEPITGYGAIEWYNADTDKYYIIRDETYINAIGSLAFVQSKAYTNEKIAQIPQISNEYTDNAVANVLIKANNYTDLQLTDVISITGTTNQINVNNGKVSLSETIVCPGDLTAISGKVRIPYGTTAERPLNPQIGTIYFNTDL